MKFLTKLKLVFSIAGLTFASHQAGAEDLRLGVITPPTHVWTKAANHFADNLKERSNGELTVSVFPSGQLGKEPEMFQQMQAGLLDMGLMTGAITSLRAPAVQGWFSPFAFDSVEEAAEAAKSEAALKMLSDLDQVGLKGLGYSFAGMRHVLLRDGTFKGLDDLQGKKIRIIPIPAMKTWWQATGAVPTPVHLPDIYQALQNGLLDGVDIDLDALVGLRFQEVAKNLTLTNHMAFPAIAMVSQKRWQTMPQQHKDWVKASMDETLSWSVATQIKAEKSNLEKLQTTMDVHKLENAKMVFEDANSAFQKSVATNELIIDFQTQTVN